MSPDPARDPDRYADADLPPVPQPPARVFVSRGMGRPAPRPVKLQLPGSKYYTLRYLLNALLADGESLVRNPALSDDTAVLVRAIRALGATAMWERATADGAQDYWQLRVQGTSGQLRVPPGGVLSVGNAGAVLRLLLGLSALLPRVTFETVYPESLGRRPNADLLDALRSLGMQTEAREPEGLLPIILAGGPPRGGEVVVSGGHSSQYLSALLYLAPLLPEGLHITVSDGLRSAPLVRATLRALAAAGVVVEAAPDLRTFVVPGGQRFQPRDYDVPGDTPSAAALAAAALTSGVTVRLERLDAAAQDVCAMMAALDALGAPIIGRPEADGGVLALAGAARLHGATIDGDAIIDSVPVLVAAACFASGETRFENVATLRLKESDRIGDLCHELRRAGADVEPHPESIIVHGQPSGIRGGVTVSGHDDHRLVQSLAIAALLSEHGLTIDGADAVTKSYPGFFADLVRLGARIAIQVVKTLREQRDEARQRGIRLLSDEIMAEARRLGVAGKAFRALNDDEAEQVAQAVEQRYVAKAGMRWWWEGFARRGLSVSGIALHDFDRLVPRAESVFLIVNVDAHSPEPELVYEGSPSAICAVLDACSLFEFYLVARDLSWLVCENHHGTIYGLGFHALRRLRQYAGRTDIAVQPVEAAVRSALPTAASSRNELEDRMVNGVSETFVPYTPDTPADDGSD